MEEYNMWLRTVLWKYKQKLETYRFDRYRNKYDNLSSRIKFLAKMKMGEEYLPQDGRFSTVIAARAHPIGPEAASRAARDIRAIRAALMNRCKYITA